MQADIIYSSVPLEFKLCRVHPRLHLDAAGLEHLREVAGREPWASFLADTRAVAELRTRSETSLAKQAFMFALTRGKNWLEKASQGIAATMAETREKPASAAKFFKSYNLALCYDWLYHDLEPELRQELLVYLDTICRREYEVLAKHETYMSGAYGWNIASERFLGIAAAGFAIYGEAPKVGPWLRFVAERARTITQALGPDGASPEGVCYGSLFNDAYVKTLDLVRRLLGINLFADNQYLRNLPWFLAYSSVPSQRLRADDAILCLGDGSTGFWHGPADVLYLLAAEYRDPLAQWIAERYSQAGASSPDTGLYSMLWFDPRVSETLPAPLPTARHFQDKGLVIMRSGWDEDETMLACKCGPHGGFHELRNYRQSVSGGHMCPDAGSFKLYARGSRLISDGTYTRKSTVFGNTVLINGQGQTGEGGDWFECKDLRKEKRGPQILRADFSPERDYLIANLAPAYDAALGLERLLRHFIYVRPDTLVLVDEIAAATAGTFELWFHGHPALPGEKAERPFIPAGLQSWLSTHPEACCRITALEPVPVVGEAGCQAIPAIGAHVPREAAVLRLRNSQPARRALFVTVLEIIPPGKAQVLPELERTATAWNLRVSLPGSTWHCHLTPGQADPAAAIIKPPE